MVNTCRVLYNNILQQGQLLSETYTVGWEIKLTKQIGSVLSRVQ